MEYLSKYEYDKLYADMKASKVKPDIVEEECVIISDNINDTHKNNFDYRLYKHAGREKKPNYVCEIVDAYDNFRYVTVSSVEAGISFLRKVSRQWIEEMIVYLAANAVEHSAKEFAFLWDDAVNNNGYCIYEFYGYEKDGITPYRLDEMEPVIDEDELAVITGWIEWRDLSLRRKSWYIKKLNLVETMESWHEPIKIRAMSTGHSPKEHILKTIIDKISYR